MPVTGAQTRATLAAVGGGVSLSGGISVGTLVGHVVADISGFTKGLTKATKNLQTFSVRMDTFLKKNAASMRRLGMRTAIVGAAVVAGVGAMVKTYGEFERRMRRATAVSEVSEEQFVQMSKMAEEAAIRLNISALRAADAFYYLGSAGLTATEQMQAFPAVATMSKAAVIEMNFSAEMMVDTLKAYRKSFDETTEVTDIFTEAVTSSNMTFSHLGETLALVAAIGKRTNNTIADLTAMIGLMANTGIKGSRAGTSLRRALLNLAAPSNEVRVELAKWNIEIYDAEKRMKPFIQIIGEFGKALEGATEEQKNLAFKTMFGVRAITGQLAIFDLGVEKVQAYVDQLNNAGGASERVAKKQMKAFLEQIGRVGQQVKTLARHIGMSLAPAISNLADKLGPIVNNMIEWVDANKEAVTAMMATAVGMGVAALVGGTLTFSLAGLAIAAIGLKTTVFALGATIATVTVGIAALTVGVVFVVARIMKMRQEVARLKNELEMSTEIDELTDYISKLDKLVTGTGPMNQLVGKMESIKFGLMEVQKSMLKAMTATRAELLQMYKEFDVTIPEGILGIPKATSVLREYFLQKAEYTRDMIIEMAKTAKEEADGLMKDVTKSTETEIRKQMTIFEVASEERKRERADEYNDWRIKTEAWAGQWSEIEYRRIQSTKAAIEDTESALTSFFVSSTTEFENWGDHIINFLKDVQRAIANVFAEAFAQQIMATTLARSVMGGFFPSGGGGTPAAPTSQVQLATVPHAKGGIATTPHIGIFGERPEAFVPLPDGRTIPVTMKGGGGGDVVVNVINQSSQKLDVKSRTSRIDMDKHIVKVVVDNYQRGGEVRNMLAGR